RRRVVVAGRVPIAAPLVDVLAEVVKAERVRRAEADRLGSGEPSRGIAGTRLRRIVAPRVPRSLHAAARGALPLRLGRQAEIAPRRAGEPFAVAHGVEPGDGDDRLPRIGERGTVPRGRRRMAAVAQKLAV